MKRNRPAYFLKVRLGGMGILFLAFYFLAVPSWAEDSSQSPGSLVSYGFSPEKSTVIGRPSVHVVRDEDTLLDIARKYGIGINELTLLHPEIDPWTPPAGMSLAVPTSWILPKRRNREQIIINIPELRLYLFSKDNTSVQTYPVGLGSSKTRTPIGRFFVTRKRKTPTWHIPESLRAKYGRATIPPGPENPLGRFVVGFSAGDYAIHGTNIPWGVGRLVSHGCIRCYPEHMELLYPQIKADAELRVIYEPIKFGQKNGQVFVEVHPDLYGRIPDFKNYASNKLNSWEFKEYVDPSAYERAIEALKGVPLNISDPIKILSRDDDSNPTEPYYLFRKID